MTIPTRGTITILTWGGRRGQSGETMKGTRETTTTTMKRVSRKKRRGRDTYPGCDIMFKYNEAEVGVSEVKASGYDNLLASRVEGLVSPQRV